MAKTGTLNQPQNQGKWMLSFSAADLVEVFEDFEGDVFGCYLVWLGLMF